MTGLTSPDRVVLLRVIDCIKARPCVDSSDPECLKLAQSIPVVAANRNWLPEKVSLCPMWLFRGFQLYETDR